MLKPYRSRGRIDSRECTGLKDISCSSERKWHSTGIRKALVAGSE